MAQPARAPMIIEAASSRRSRHHAGRDAQHRFDVLARLDDAGGIVRRTDERDGRVRLRDDAFDFGSIESEVSVAPTLDHRGTDNAGDLRMHLVRRREHRDVASGPRIREKDALQNLVRSIGNEHVLPEGTALPDARARADVGPVPYAGSVPNGTTLVNYCSRMCAKCVLVSHDKMK